MLVWDLGSSVAEEKEEVVVDFVVAVERILSKDLGGGVKSEEQRKMCIDWPVEPPMRRREVYTLLKGEEACEARERPGSVSENEAVCEGIHGADGNVRARLRGAEDKSKEPHDGKGEEENF